MVADQVVVEVGAREEFAIVEKEEVVLEIREEGRSSRLRRGKTAFFDAMVRRRSSVVYKKGEEGEKKMKKTDKIPTLSQP